MKLKKMHANALFMFKVGKQSLKACKGGIKIGYLKYLIPLYMKLFISEWVGFDCICVFLFKEKQSKFEAKDIESIMHVSLLVIGVW